MLGLVRRVLEVEARQAVAQHLEVEQRHQEDGAVDEPLAGEEDAPWEPAPADRRDEPLAPATVAEEGAARPGEQQRRRAEPWQRNLRRRHERGVFG